MIIEQIMVDLKWNNRIDKNFFFTKKKKNNVHLDKDWKIGYGENMIDWENVVLKKTNKYERTNEQEIKPR